MKGRRVKDERRLKRSKEGNMRFLSVMILLACMVLGGCSGARIYTFEKDRVDQRMEGNRGYVKGTPPSEPIKKGVAKRTMIGVDVEVPLLPGEEGYKPTSGGTVIHAEDIKMEPRSGALKGKAPETAPAKSVYREETVVVEEKAAPKGKIEKVIIEEEEVWVK